MLLKTLLITLLNTLIKFLRTIHYQQHLINYMLYETLDYQFKLRLFWCKVKNLIHYRLDIEESLWDTRWKCQYIHVIRDIRKDAVDLGLTDITSIISPTIKNTECLDTIKQLKLYVQEK